MKGIPPTTAVVLAGGRGRRMHGRDKGLEPLRGQPLAGRVLDALRPQVDALLISANRNLARYAALGAPVVVDLLPGFQGPLAGMLAGLRAATTDWVLFAPCDALHLPHDLARRLHAAALDGGAAAYARAGEDDLYTCCLLHRRLADQVEAALRKQRRALRDFLHACGAAAVEFSDWPAALRNANTLDALQACA